jgi:phosphatidyl-myo-inositol dimannoside synthase
LTPINVLYISHLHPEEGSPLDNMGGMQRVSMQLVEALRQRDDVVLTTEILHANWEGIAAQTFKFAVELLFRIPKLIEDHSIDVVLFSSMVTAALAPLIRKKVDVPMVAINHGRDVTLPVGPYQAYIKKVFQALDATVSVSNATRVECLTRGMNFDSAYVLPNGLPVGSRPIVPDKATARQNMYEKFGVPVDGKFVLSVGRQVKRKGHQWFLESVLPLLTGMNRVVFVGDGPEHETLQRIVQADVNPQTVYLLGRVSDDDLNILYDAADVFVMPNIPVPGDMEGFGIVMIEANVRGVPVVASNLEGITDVVTNGVNGYLVEPLNEVAFSGRVNSIGTDNDVFESELVSSHVIQNFGWESVVAEYVNLFRSLIRSRKGVYAQI